MATIRHLHREPAGFAVPVCRPTIADIQRAVTEHFGLRSDALAARRRTRRYAYPRQLAMWLCQQLTGHASTHIGERFGRDHTTVLHAVKVVPPRLLLDPEFRQDCHAVIARIDAIRRHNVIPFPRPAEQLSQRAADSAADSATAVLADEMQRDLPGTLAKLLRRTVDGPEIEGR